MDALSARMQGCVKEGILDYCFKNDNIVTSNLNNNTEVSVTQMVSNINLGKKTGVENNSLLPTQRAMHR